MYISLRPGVPKLCGGRGRKLNKLLSLLRGYRIGLKGSAFHHKSFFNKPFRPTSRSTIPPLSPKIPHTPILKSPDRPTERRTMAYEQQRTNNTPNIGPLQIFNQGENLNLEFGKNPNIYLLPCVSPWEGLHVIYYFL